MSDSRKPDASQRQELSWLLDEADSAVESWWQTEEVRWPEILTKLVSRLRLCGFDLEAEGIASDVQAAPKIGRQGCRNHRDLLQIRQQVVDRVRKRIVAIRKVMAGEATHAGMLVPLENDDPNLIAKTDSGSVLLFDGHKEPTVATEASANGPEKSLRKPTERDEQAYRLRLVTGKTQEEIAKDLDCTQGQVSRSINKVEEWVAAGNVLPPLESGGKPQVQSMDPQKIDMGKRMDGRTPSQRPNFSDD